MPALIDLLQKRNNLISQAREVIDRAKSETRALTAEEQSQYDKLFGEASALGDTIEREQRQSAVEKSLDASITSMPKPNPGDSPEQRSEKETRSAYAKFLRWGQSSLTPEESRALSQNVKTEGGFMVAPVQMATMLIKAVDDLLFIRGLATKYQVTGSDSLGAASLDNDPEDGTWTSEVGQADEDTQMSFGSRVLKPQMLAKRIKVSNNLLRNASQDAEALVNQRLAYKLAVTHEKAFMTGSGAGQPLGLFTASADGVSTARDVSTGNTSTSIAFAGLINAKYALKAQYLAGAAWIFHRDGVKQIAGLRSDSGAGAGTGDYMWQPSTQLGQPDRLLGLPVYMSEYAPNTFTTGLYVGLVGNFAWYWIADDLEIQIQRLVELYAENNQTGFIARASSDGMPVLAEAFARVKLA